jgi:hypothetical protein
MVKTQRELDDELAERVTGRMEGQPRRLSALALLLSVPSVARAFKAIPWAYWTREVGQTQEHDGSFTEVAVARVRCPCGQEPLVELGQLTECGCERFFAFGGRQVLSANPPTEVSD